MPTNARAPRRVLPEAPDTNEVYPELGASWPVEGLGAIALIATQLPDPKELQPGTLVIVHPSARAPSSWLGRALHAAQFWRKEAVAHSAVRCTALLALGYRDVGVAAQPSNGKDVVWGLATTSARSSSEP